MSYFYVAVAKWIPEEVEEVEEVEAVEEGATLAHSLKRHSPRGRRGRCVKPVIVSHCGRTGRRDKYGGRLHALPTSRDSLPPGRLPTPTRLHNPPNLRHQPRTKSLHTGGGSRPLTFKPQRVPILLRQCVASAPLTPHQGAASSFA